MDRNSINISGTVVSLVALGALAFSHLTSASPFEVRAGMPSVPGTEEFEAGNIDGAIAKLKPQVGNVHGEREGSVLSTLCAAYIVKGQFGEATPYCEASVKHGQRIAHNNRGVLRALQGDFAGANNDFSKAAQKSYSQFEMKVTSERRAVAERNSKRSQERWAQTRQQGEDLLAGQK